MSTSLCSARLCSLASLVLLAVFSAGSLFFSAPIHAQIGTSGTALSQLGQRVGTTVPEGVPLEGALDSEVYLVGPGDVFAFSLGGALPTQQQARVSADGMLIVSGLGSFAVANRTLAEVKAELHASLRRLYRNVETDVALMTPRSFYVHVSGAVLEPGRHVVTPIGRVEDALVSAMGGVSPQRLLTLAPARQALALRALASSEATSLEPGSLQPSEGVLPQTHYPPSFRNVLVTHRDGTTERVDLLRYYATGDPETNPYLRDGETITLPFYNPTTESVGVAGDVPEPGLFDHRPGDTALAVLLVALGPGMIGQIDTVRLTRAQPTNGAVVTMLAADEFETTPVEPGDRLFVVSAADTYGTADVLGAARYPASYPIRIGETTLQELLAMAGGFAPDALARGAHLERRGLVRPDENRTTPDPIRLAFDPTLSIEVREAAIAAASFEQTRLSTLDFASRQYFAREALGYQRVSLNVEQVLQEGEPPVRLQDGDRLVIPYDLGTVAVIGQVAQAGYVPFMDGQDASHYLAQAGGLAPGATAVYVVDAATGVYRSLPEASTLQRGDFIFADRAPTAEDRLGQQILVQQRQAEVQERRERSDSRFRLIATTIQALSLAVTVYAIATR